MSVRGLWCVHDYLLLSAELLNYLQSSTNWANIEEKELINNGFTKCVDHPNVPNHIYYEGYFHGLDTTSSSVLSLNPRLGSNMQKAAAPLSLRAFINSFKQLNNKWLMNAIKGTFIDKMNLFNNLFCDFAVQIHYGDHVDSDNIGWHMDSINSILHLAISLHGKRALYYKTNKDMTSLNHNKNDKENKQKVEIMWRQSGECYLSSTYAFLHAVEYPKTSFKNKIIAIQCRWLITKKQYELACINYSNDWRNDLNNITNILSKTKVIMPTLQQVMEMEQIIKEKQDKVDLCIML